MQIANSAAPLGAQIIDLDLSKKLDDVTFRAIEEVLHDRGVIVFREQRLTEEEYIAFSRRFGELEIHVASQYLRPGYPEILIVSNIIENCRLIGLADAGQYWHSDLSYVANPSRCSLLYALEVPVRDGLVLGETMFASTAWAYDTLPEPMRTRLEGLTAIHRYGDRYRMQQAGGRPRRTQPRTAKESARCSSSGHPSSSRDRAQSAVR